MKQMHCTFERKIEKVVQLDYLLYLPQKDDVHKKWPLILFLHGMGERGNQIEDVKVHGIPKNIQEKKDYSFIIVSPQCPIGEMWSTVSDALYYLLQDIKDHYPVDEDRVYLTGLSMGGYGTWDLAMHYPNEFAAIAPVCGGMFDAETVVKLKHMPIWAFHGVKDKVVPISETQRLVDILEACGGNIRFTAYPDLEHDCWTPTYNNPALYEWFLKHKRHH
ncbi:carboxylesterase family protein [Vallitalea pronyensis]|nr:alpha/beta hydrolase-fold protein [Vallitalea pronyensis]